MIVWGGGSNDGGRYNVTSGLWSAVTTTGAPAARSDHTAIWTGSDMVVWGGGQFSDGGRFNPGTGSWTAATATGAPPGRRLHTAVWTGSEMLVFGGYSDSTSAAVNDTAVWSYTPPRAVYLYLKP